MTHILANDNETRTTEFPARNRMLWSTEDPSVMLTWSSMWKLEQWMSLMKENLPYLQSKNNCRKVSIFLSETFSPL